MTRRAEDNFGNTIFKGPYAVMACAHACGHVIEAGPKDAADWAFCILCQAPTCKRAWCMNHCPHIPRDLGHKYDRARVDARIEAAICTDMKISDLKELKKS